MPRTAHDQKRDEPSKQLHITNVQAARVTRAKNRPQNRGDRIK